MGMRLSKQRVRMPIGAVHTVMMNTSPYWACVWLSGSAGEGGAALPFPRFWSCRRTSTGGGRKVFGSGTPEGVGTPRAVGVLGAPGLRNLCDIECDEEEGGPRKT